MRGRWLLFSLVFSLFSFCAAAQTTGAIQGAWKGKMYGNNVVLHFQDGYFSYAEYTPTQFVSTWGGPYSMDGNNISIKVEFNSLDKNLVGTSEDYSFEITGGGLLVEKDGGYLNFSRIDDSRAPLAGVWKISQRQQEGKLVRIHQTGARKTLKLLTGERFQWFAINPETKEFSGTGGGTYTFENGKYTEHIEFFSRDNKRIGASLPFDGKIVDGEWHHSGLSSKGDKIYEVWTKAVN